MSTPRFDPTHALEFNFERGTVKLGSQSDRVVVPADVLTSLFKSADPDTRKDFAYRLGTEAGRRIAERIDGSAGVPGVVEHLGGELALMGLGSLGLERWGRALVITVVGSPLRADGDELLAGILEGALQRAFGRASTVVPVQRDDARVRLLVVSKSTAERVRGWLDSGVSFGDVLARLNGGGSA